MPSLTYATSVSDSAGNTYTNIPAFSTTAGPYPDELYRGMRIEAFWCPSSVGTVSTITANWNQITNKKAIIAFRFRNHSGDPFSVRTYGHYDQTAFASDRTPATVPSPLPSWTFTNSNGRLFFGTAAFYDSLTTGEFSTYNSTGFGWSGSLSGGINLYSGVSGTFRSPGTLAVNPTIYTLDWATNTNPVYNVWRPSFYFGLEAIAGQYISESRSFIHNFSSTTSFSLTTSAPSGFLNSIAAGDGILLICVSPPRTVRSYQFITSCTYDSVSDKINIVWSDPEANTPRNYYLRYDVGGVYGYFYYENQNIRYFTNTNASITPRIEFYNRTVRFYVACFIYEPVYGGFTFVSEPASVFIPYTQQIVSLNRNLQ